MRPTTANKGMQSVMPSSRGRPGTKRGSTQMGAITILPPTVGLKTDVRVSYRPVTSQGLSGMQTKPLGPSRQIADKSYWLKILRDKVSEMTGEIKKMQSEIIKHQQDNQTQTALVRRYEETIKEVRSLEGELADFNLALDKLRTNTDITEIKDTYDQLKFDNERDRKQIDSLFIETNNYAQQTAKMEAKIQANERAAAEAMEKLGVEFERKYEHLRDQYAQNTHTINQMEETLESLDYKVQQARSSMKSAEYRRHERGLQLKRRLETLKKQEKEIIEEERSNLSPQEMKQKLLIKVKQAKKEIGTIKENMKNVKGEIENLEGLIERKRKDIQEASKIKEKSAKYSQLYERDSRITEFIEAFPTNFKQVQDSISEKKELIVLVMENASTILKKSGNASGMDAHKVKQELSFKEKQTALSQDTLALAKADLKKREAELHKIETLSDKILVELKSLASKRSDMTAEMRKFRDPQQLEAEAKRVKNELMKTKGVLKERVDSLTHLFKIASQPIVQRAKELMTSDTNKKIEAGEKKLRAYSQSVHQLEETVARKKRSSQYDRLVVTCMDACDKINEITVSRLT